MNRTEKRINYLLDNLGTIKDKDGNLMTFEDIARRFPGSINKVMKWRTYKENKKKPTKPWKPLDRF